MYDILNPKDVDTRPHVDAETATPLIVEGIKWGIIDELHSAVEYVNEMTPDNIIVNGNDVEGIFKIVVKDLKKLDSEVTAAAISGNTVEEMAEISGTFFKYDDIEIAKIEVFGTVEAWLASLVTEGV
jgi:hypothetical protein